jgi:tetratricopeptide (TPR) repeat protein
MSRGMTLLQSGRSNQAWADFNTLVDLDGSDGWAIGSRGQASQAMGKNKEALDDYEQALALDSSLNDNVSFRTAHGQLRWR